MDKDTNLQVTFSKRRTGLFKKANELSILCGASVVVIVFSPADKFYSFGHPSVDRFIIKYLSIGNANNSSTRLGIRSSPNLTIQRLNMEVSTMDENTFIQDAIKKQLEDLKKAQATHYWWAVPDKDELDEGQLHLLMAMLEELKDDVHNRIHTLNSTSNYYVREPVIHHTNLIGPYDAMGTSHTEDISSFDRVTIDQSMGFIVPYEYRVANELDGEIPNSLTYNIPVIGNSHQSLGNATSGTNPTIPFDPIDNSGVGLNGQNIFHGSTSGFNGGYP